MAIPTDANARLRRKTLAEALTEAGFPTAEATLATKASRGGGPPFQSFGRIPLYKWGDALAWAEGRLSAPHHSTSEIHAQSQESAIKDGRAGRCRRAHLRAGLEVTALSLATCPVTPEQGG